MKEILHAPRKTRSNDLIRSLYSDKTTFTPPHVPTNWKPISQHLIGFVSVSFLVSYNFSCVAVHPLSTYPIHARILHPSIPAASMPKIPLTSEIPAKDAFQLLWSCLAYDLRHKTVLPPSQINSKEPVHLSLQLCSSIFLSQNNLSAQISGQPYMWTIFRTSH